MVQAVNLAAAKDSGTKGFDRKRFLLLGTLVALLVAGGALLVLYIRINTPVRPMPGAEPAMVRAPLPEAVQKPLSSALTPPAEPAGSKEKVRINRFASITKKAAPSAPAPKRQQAAEKKLRHGTAKPLTPICFQPATPRPKGITCWRSDPIRKRWRLIPAITKS